MVFRPGRTVGSWWCVWCIRRWRTSPGSSLIAPGRDGAASRPGTKGARSSWRWEKATRSPAVPWELWSFCEINMGIFDIFRRISWNSGDVFLLFSETTTPLEVLKRMRRMVTSPKWPQLVNLKYDSSRRMETVMMIKFFIWLEVGHFNGQICGFLWHFAVWLGACAQLRQWCVPPILWASVGAHHGTGCELHPEIIGDPCLFLFLLRGESPFWYIPRYWMLAAHGGRFSPCRSLLSEACRAKSALAKAQLAAPNSAASQAAMAGDCFLYSIPSHGTIGTWIGMLYYIIIGGYWIIGWSYVLCSYIYLYTT